MPYSALRNKKAELIRKARDGSCFIASASSPSITTLTFNTGSEVQTVTITGGPTGGTFTLTFSGQTTAAIAYNATAAAVKTALDGLSNIDPGDVVVGGGPLPGTAVTVTFSGWRYSGQNVALMTANSAALTGGTTPTVTVTETTAGGAAATLDLRPLPYGYSDLGWISSDGVTYGRETEVSDVTSFGSVEPTRSDVTSDTINIQVSCQETKFNTLELYTGADLSATTAAAGTGEFGISKPARPGFRYYRLLGLFVDTDDNGNEIYIGRYMPRARVIEYGEQQFTDGDDPLMYQVTLQGYEDSTLGYSHRWIFGGAGWLSLLTSMGITQAA